MSDYHTGKSYPKGHPFYGTVRTTSGAPTTSIIALQRRVAELEAENAAVTAQLDELAAANKTLKGQYDELKSVVLKNLADTDATCKQSIQVAAAERDALRKDKARLDWLEKNYDFPYRDDVYGGHWGHGMMHGAAPYPGTWRAAIDAAKGGAR